MLWISIAIALTAAASGCLFWSWRNKPKQRLGVNSLAWSGLIAALVCFCQALDIEYGLAIGLIAISLGAWFFTLLNAQRQSSRVKKTLPQRPLAWSLAGVVKNTLLGFLLLIGYGIISALLSLYGAYAIDIGEANQMALVLILMPVLWASFILTTLFFINKAKAA
ncbi:MAG: hypothetical protein OIF35_03775 [Cellvibrionaceae bacterium]|nr:hypothetical protein [Cellvibrionaceae bacterium]MCV6627184.1 hypothetical protein [Cellvibrionaceae bacterium]